MVYPYYEKLAGLAPGMNRGNFGLWYNKLVPLNDFHECNASDAKGDENKAVTYYEQQYGNTVKGAAVREFLDEKHSAQTGFCAALSARYEIVTIRAELISPLVTGIGESHPHEVSMVFDHNMGIPYIPASGVKGIVRFAHTLSLLANLPEEKVKRDKDGKKVFDDEADWTDIPELFGTHKKREEKRGKVVFLDAYPEKVPDLYVDIMNPHYGQYYSDDTNKQPPGDYLDPKPIKFLTVARGTVFVFRALVDREITGLVDKVKVAFNKALTEEGVGAKTAVGYGYFDILGGDGTRGNQPDPEKDLEKRLSEFEKSLPNSHDLPGQITPIIERIKAQEDERLRRKMAAVLLALARSDKKKFKKAKSKGKAWVQRLVEVCQETGVEV
ncbi:MAG: type III-B CRISPR module RAMP protein Cmr6 [Deltaproteobacteria bacterium]|nr:type III-B CRISPR module RAMP protein Cmr6 [Deltaproteobacteria bacterium]